MRESDNILWQTLRFARPDNSQAIQDLMEALEELAQPHAVLIERDGVDNLWIDTRKDGTGSTMFMAHLDTVERTPGIKILQWDDEAQTIVSTGGKHVLGADDGAGIAILAHLLVSGVPALYLFTQGEETGGDGGKYAAEYEASRVEGINRCIAFDRKGKTEICGAQWMGDLASREFVSALSDALGMGHVWGQGTYTDNSEWEGKIPEIVNISCGYENNHGPDETLDYAYLTRLREAVVKVDWESLPTIGAPAKTRTYQDWEPWPETSDDDAVQDALWDICDTLGMDPGSYEASCIRASLEELADRLGSNVSLLRR